MAIIIRKASAADTAECGRIIFEAFDTIARQHSFPPDFPSAEVTTGIASLLIGHPDFFGLVAEDDGHVVGSNFVDFRSSIGGIGPITVDPRSQNNGIGGRLMLAVMDEAVHRERAGVRLVQVAYHNRSLCLYTKLGFRTREPLSIMQGAPIAKTLGGYVVRPTTDADLPSCDRLCRRVHGMTRSVEVRESVKLG